MATLGVYNEALRTALTEYRQLAEQRDALAERLANLDAVIKNLQGLTGSPSVTAVSQRASARARSRPRPKSKVEGISIRGAALEALQQAGAALHVREIIELLLKRGVLKPGLDYEKYRLSVVGSIKRRPDVMLVGRGQYIYRGVGIETRTVSRRPKVTVVQLIHEGLTATPGITSAELADRVEPKVQSGAKDPRKVVHSVLSYLLRGNKVRKDAQGRIYWEVHNNNGSGANA